MKFVEFVVSACMLVIMVCCTVTTVGMTMKWLQGGMFYV